MALPQLHRTRAVAWAVLALLAAAGLTVVFIAAWRQSAASVYTNDLGSLAAPRAWLAGRSVHVAYGPGQQDGYPLPVELLLTPVAVLPDVVRVPIVKLLSVALVLAALMLWTRERRDLALVGVLALSLPVASLIPHDHLPTALGLAAFSLSFWAASRDRWLLAGAALALGFLRTANAPAVALMLLVAAGWNLNRQSRLIGGVLLILGPLTALAFGLDPTWVTDWQGNLKAYPVAGLVKLVALHGPAAVLAAQLIVAALAGLLMARRPGPEPDLDRAALGLALTVIVAPMDGIYASAFVLPAILRAGSRARYRQIPWLTAFGSWAVVALLTPGLLSAHPAGSLQLLSAVVFWLLVNTYPLLRRAPEPARLAATAGT